MKNMLVCTTLKTPFEKASERDRLGPIIQPGSKSKSRSPLFSEAFSLKRVYVPIRAYYEEREFTAQQRSTAITAATQPRTRELHHAELLLDESQLDSAVPGDPLESLPDVRSHFSRTLFQAYLKNLKLLGPIKRRLKRAVSAEEVKANEELVERLEAHLVGLLDVWNDGSGQEHLKLPVGPTKRRPKHAVSTEVKAPDVSNEERVERIAVDLEESLDAWVDKADAQDAMRVISGGPGSGKSSFAKMFAARQAEKQKEECSLSLCTDLI